jgi:hypothetical protein|tara:strand:- start:318 stop:878 length:561 start_codon:yes stop_codon:yes gene_type:complete
MKKKSIRTAPYVFKPTINAEDIPSSTGGEEGLSSSTNEGVGRGFSMMGEPTTPAVILETEEGPLFLGKHRHQKRNIDHKRFKSLMDLLVGLANAADDQDEIKMADFTDFLITKFAQQINIDHSILFKDLIIKIIESDIFNQDEIVVNLTNHYNRLIVLSVSSGMNILDAKKKAYNMVANKAERYVK